MLVVTRLKLSTFLVACKACWEEQGDKSQMLGSLQAFLWLNVGIACDGGQVRFPLPVQVSGSRTIVTLF
jgi:hypothetical protein